MQFKYTTIFTSILASANALGDFGLNLGVQAGDGSCKTADDYAADFKAMSGYTKIVKTYAVSDCNTLEILGPAAESAGFQIMAGIWPTDDTHYQAEKDALQTYLPKISKSTISVFTVGSEALYRDDLSASDLASKISDIKSFLKGIKDKNGDSYGDIQVGFVDSWNILVDGVAQPAIKAADFTYANAFSYWQGQTQKNSSYSFFDDIMQALQVIQTTKGSTDINFWVGETGWPTQGTAFESAEPGTDNAKTYFQQAVCGLRAWGVNVAVFEAFDESWKPDTSGTSDVEKYWGIWGSDRTIKYSIDCDF